MLYWFLSYSIYIICWIASYCKGNDNVLSKPSQCIVRAFAMYCHGLRLGKRLPSPPVKGLKTQFLGYFQHAVDGTYGLLCHLGINVYLRCLVQETIVEFLHRDEFHI